MRFALAVVVAFLLSIALFGLAVKMSFDASMRAAARRCETHAGDPPRSAFDPCNARWGL